MKNDGEGNAIMDRIAQAVRSMVAWTITAFAPCIISQTSKEPKGPLHVPYGKTPGRDNREIATIDHQTKKPLDSQGNQGFSLIGPAGFEPTTSTTPR